VAVQPALTKDPYKVLEVRPGALEELVTEAYWHHVYRLQQELRRNPAVTSQVKELNQAYEAVISEYAFAAERGGARMPLPSMEAAEETIWQNPRDFYAILHIDRDASPDLIDLAYDVLRARFTRRKPVQAQILRKLQEAHTVLSTRELREKFDAGELPLPEEQPLEEVVQADFVDRMYLSVFEPLGRRLGAVLRRGRGETESLEAIPPGIAGPSGRLSRMGALLSAPLRLLPFRRRRTRRLKLPTARPANGAAPARQAPEPLATVTPLGAWLELSGGRKIALPRKPVTIGADAACEVILQGDAVAPTHARIWYRDGRFLFHRLDRPREVKVSGRPLDWAVLESGDVIEIGAHKLVFHEPGAAGAPAATAANGSAE
jgi:curved DNA-binding protein CbpA